MASPETLTLLAELYHGEFIGERVLDLEMDRHEDPILRHVFATAAQFETETKARLRPALVRLGISLAPPAGLDATVAAASAQPRPTSAMAFVEQTHAMMLNVYVPRYEEIAALAEADGDPLAVDLARSMVVHEKALCEMLRRLIAGEDDPTAPVDALLTYPLPAPV